MSNFDIISAPVKPAVDPYHRCKDTLPDKVLLTDIYNYTGYPVGTLARCPECQEWFVSARTNVYLDLIVWRPVRWYHLRLRSRIRTWEK